MFPTLLRSRRSFGVALAVVLSALLAVSLLHGAEDSQAGGRSWGIGPGIKTVRVPANSHPKPRPVVKRAPARPTTTKPAPGKTATPVKPTDRPASGPSTPSRDVTEPFVGTLVTNADSAAQESRAGLKMAMLEFQWRYLEPSRGVYNTKYATNMAAQLKKFQQAGMRVTLGLGLHFVPQWALDMAGSRMVNQNGVTSPRIDLVFNQQMRELAAEYLRMLDRAVGLSNFWAIRITSGGEAELFYPSTAYWAYSDGAQNGPSKPASLPANPMPGWKPSDTATAAQREAFARWYVGALSNVADWQMATINSLGFDGYYQLLTPGQGLRPKQFASTMKSNLVNGTLGRGAVWYQLFANLTQRRNVTVYVSSVADNSANNDVCRSDDDSVSLASDTVFNWSASRWLTRVAGDNGFTVAGEVAGYNKSSASAAYYRDSSSRGMLATAMAQVKGCNFLGLYWAHDTQVRDGTIPLSRLAGYTSPGAKAPALATAR